MDRDTNRVPPSDASADGMAGTHYLTGGGFEAEDALAGQWTIPNPQSDGCLSLDHKSPHSGTSCLRITVPAEGRQGWPHGAICRIESAPAGRRVLLSAWVRTESVAPPAGVCVYVGGYDTEGRTVSHSRTGTVRSEAWTRIETQAAVPAEVTHFQVMPFLSGPGTAWVDDIALVDAGPADKLQMRRASMRPPEGPVLALARGQWRFEPEQDAAGFRVWFPIPLCSDDQAPLGFRLEVEPAESLLGYTLRERLLGNWMAELRMADMAAGSTATVTWEVPALLRPHDYGALPAEIACPAPIPDDVCLWLAATRCVQADHDGIRERAARLRAASPDLLAFARGAVRVFLEAPQGAQAPTLDAVAALSGWGSCTNHANLAAALLRAAGIPARVLAGYPTWCGPTQTHYIVQFWAGEYGWVLAESSRGDVPCPSTSQVQVAIAYPEDEDRSFRDFEGEDPHARVAMGGGGFWMSATEADERPGLDWIGTIGVPGGNCDHEAVVLTEFESKDPDLNAAFEAATAFWPAYRAIRAKGGDLPEAAGRVQAMEDSRTAGELLGHLTDAARLL
jgi:hypothetical protein